MVLTLKHRIKYYRKFRADIWGLAKLAIRKTVKNLYKRPFKFFLKRRKERKVFIRQKHERYFYQIARTSFIKRRRRLNKRFTSIRIVKLFYLTLTYKQIYKMAQTAKKRDGFFANNYLLALEGRLLSFLYWTGFVSNMFESLFYIKQKFVILDKKITNFANKQACLFQILSFHPMIKKKIYRDLLTRIVTDKRTLFNPPKYIYVSYWFLLAFMIAPPRKLIYPLWFFDCYRATGFVFNQ